MANKMLRFCLTLTLALALPAFAQTGPAQPKSVRPTEPIALGTEYMTWSTGVSYTYDGSGNIRSIGSDSYVYDAAGRLVQSDLTGTRSNFGYDAFGNRISCTQGAGNCQYSAIDTTTNRLSSATYETGGSGNVASFWGHTYAYDAVNMATRDLTASSTREFVYTADDERLAVYTVGGGAWNWTVRDAGGKVLREFTSQNPASGPVGSGSWTWSKDYVWRDGSLLASRQTDSVSGSITTDHYHLDHLGTPRRITDEQNRIVGIHDYYAFGPEDPHGTNESPMTRLKFTGHERDLTGSGTGPGTLDYMHARYYDPAVGRFLSPDPVLDVKTALRFPQALNRYSYVRNSPLNFTDPTGKVAELSSECADKKTTCKELRALRDGVPAELRMFIRARTVNGRTVIDTRFLNMKSDASSGNFQALRAVAGDRRVVTLNMQYNGNFVRYNNGASDSYGIGTNTRGITIPASLSLLGHTEVYVEKLSGRLESAEVMAHEIRHARRDLLGLPNSDATLDPRTGTWVWDPNSPANQETEAAEAEARENFDPFQPPL